ncbi:hypothetical protein [Bradyrhizobium sp. BWA-3-5]|uniref:hypothetical protein n=1 Tax=Bradyrhizobium sp. BWA-3-5 TaxID=3080013 RepID=UPI00293E797C|nr:hypothetical protein [Bradyrhizobium sp. BWA-3-5]WOH63814.1 hypothetical protein RX331_24325 [Bradyrhizobium sp. BWA-3-5]
MALINEVQCNMVRMTNCRKQRLHVIEGGRADSTSRPDDSPPQKWNFWPIVAILLNALLWVGIFKLVRAFL